MLKTSETKQTIKQAALLMSKDIRSGNGDEDTDEPGALVKQKGRKKDKGKGRDTNDLFGNKDDLVADTNEAEIKHGEVNVVRCDANDKPLTGRKH